MPEPTVQVHGLPGAGESQISFQSLDRLRYMLKRELPDGISFGRYRVSWKDFSESIGRVVDDQVRAALLCALAPVIPRRHKMKMRLIKALRQRKPSFDKFVFPVIANMQHHDLIEQLVPIQPMQMPVPNANMFYLDIVRGPEPPKNYVRRKEVPRDEMAFPLDEDKIVNETRKRESEGKTARLFTRSIFGASLQGPQGTVKSIVAA